MCLVSSPPNMNSVISLSVHIVLLAGLASGVTNFRFSSTSMSVLEGESIRMECRFSRKTDDRYLSWGYVPPGSRALKRLVYWSPKSQDSTFMVGNSHHYVAEKNFRQSQISLRIANATQRDSTRYFCQMTNHLEDKNATDWCGCGSTLSVKAVPPSSSPSVQLHYPPPGEISENGLADLLCLVSGFYPPSVRISWYMDGTSVTSGVSEQPLSRDPTDRYTTVSRLEVRGRDWVGTDVYRCVVSHQTLTQPIVKEIRTSARYPTLPSVYVLPPAYAEMDTNGTATLGCLAVGFHPRNISFTWLVNNRQRAVSSEPGRIMLQENGTYSSSSTLKVPVREWDSRSIFTCLVKHLASRTPLTQTLSKQDVRSPHPPSTFLHRPPAEEITAGSDIELICGATGFYPRDISLTWEVDGLPVSSGLTDTGPSIQPDGSYTLIGRLTASSSQWTSGSLYTCLVSHRTLSEPIRTQVRSEARPPSPPSLRLVPPSIREILTNQTATLACVATEFYPDEITFRWMAAEAEVGGGSRALPPVANPDGTYWARSELTVSGKDWSSGARYTCEVTHEALATPLTSTVTVGDAQLLKSPEIRTLEVERPEDSLDDGTTTLACFVSGFYPGDVYLTWRAQGSEVTDGRTTFPVTPDGDGTFRTVSQLSFPSEAWERGRSYSCVVGHQSSKELIERHLRKERARPPSPPSLRLVPPSIREILTNQTATLVCVATEFYPDAISFRWTAAEAEVGGGSQALPPVANPDGTYWARSELTVSGEDWSSGARYTCEVTHEALATPLTSTVTVGDAQLLKSPEIRTLELERPKDSLDDGTTTLACFVSGFYPGDVYLTWRAQGSEVTDGRTTFPVTPDGDGTFRTVSQLSVPSEAWERGRSYSCVVGHQSSKELIERHLRKERGSSIVCVELGLSPWRWILCAVCILIVYTVIILSVYHCIRMCRQKRKGSFRAHGYNLWLQGGIQMDTIPSLDQKSEQVM